MKTLFSVVIPTYNRRAFFKDCVDSVLNQTFKNFELIIIDDGSTDHTVSLMSEYVGKSLNYIKLIDNKGVSFARNLGISLSKGKYIAFLDSDDVWDKKKLEITSGFIERYPEYKVFHTEETWIRDGKILTQKKKYKRPEGLVYESCLPVCCIGMSTSVVKRGLFDEIGLFDEKMPACEDYDFWLRACIENEVKLIPFELTMKYGGRADQLSNQHSLDKYRIYSLEKMLKSNVLDKEKQTKTRDELINKCKIYINGLRKRGKIQELSYYEKLIESY